MREKSVRVPEPSACTRLAGVSGLGKNQSGCKHAKNIPKMPKVVTPHVTTTRRLEYLLLFRVWRGYSRNFNTLGSDRHVITPFESQNGYLEIILHLLRVNWEGAAILT